MCALAFSLAFWTYLAMSPHPITKKARAVAIPQPIKTPLVPAGQETAQIDATAQAYMQALLKQDYQTMWSLLHPQIQAQWPNEAAFAAFWKTRFQNYLLQGVTLGKISQLSYWVDPETMEQYSQVEELPVSLQLELKAVPPAHALVPPEDLHPDTVFQNVPFIVQYIPGTGSSAGHWAVLDGGPADLEAPILPPLIPVSRTVQVPILMYHYISTVPANDPDPALRASLSVSPQLFSQQLDYLKAKHYHSITLNELMDALYYGYSLPSKPIILTFDDGYEDAYQNAYPLLKAHGFSGMFYIITGKVGWQGQMTWPQMREMLANGMQMGSHTVHHVDMGSVYLFSPQQAQQEAQVSQLTLEKNLGILIQHFCYPNGGPFKKGSLLLREEVVALLASDGYVSATTDPGMTGTMQSSQAPLALLRIRVDGRSSLQWFAQSLPW